MSRGANNDMNMRNIDRRTRVETLTASKSALARLYCAFGFMGQRREFETRCRAISNAIFTGAAVARTRIGHGRGCLTRWNDHDLRQECRQGRLHTDRDGGQRDHEYSDPPYSRGPKCAAAHWTTHQAMPKSPSTARRPAPISIRSSVSMSRTRRTGAGGAARPVRAPEASGRRSEADCLEAHKHHE